MGGINNTHDIFNFILFKLSSNQEATESKQNIGNERRATKTIEIGLATNLST